MFNEMLVGSSHDWLSGGLGLGGLDSERISTNKRELLLRGTP